MIAERAEVVVVGAGLLGCCVALELATRGIEILLIDQDERPFERASLRNEGKIHLGLVYAADLTLSTAQLQMKGALSFQRLLARWIDVKDLMSSLSTPFVYVAAKDSLIEPNALERHYDAVEALYRSALRKDPDLSYLGSRPDRLFRRLKPSDDGPFVPDSHAALFATVERAVDTNRLGKLLRAAIAREPLIRFVGGARIDQLQRVSRGICAEGVRNGERWQGSGGQLVNASWESRAALDATLGLVAPKMLLLRLKYRVMVEVPEGFQSAPSATMVLGRYGDVVLRPEGPAYLSWYPACLQGWVNGIIAPPEWEGPCRGTPDQVMIEAVAEATKRAIEAWYPGFTASRVVSVDAGAIVAHGRTDVDHWTSQLHDRTRVGVNSINGYHSVDTGKLTTAPLFALEAAERVAARRMRIRAVARI